jgi:hypothetical protein
MSSGVAVVSGQIPLPLLDSVMSVQDQETTTGQSGQQNYLAAPALGPSPGAISTANTWAKVGTVVSDSLGGVPYNAIASGTAGAAEGIVFPVAMRPLLFAAAGSGPPWLNYRLELWMMFKTSPLLAGMCQQDTGLMFYMPGPFNGAGVIYNAENSTQGGSVSGFGFTVDQATGKLRFVSGPANGNGFSNQALTINTLTRAPAAGYLKPFKLEVQILTAAEGADATMVSFLDGVPLHSQSWTGGLLPNFDRTSDGYRSQGIVAAVVNASTTTANPQLLISAARMRVGSVAAILLD